MPPTITATDIIRSIAAWLRSTDATQRKLFFLMLKGTILTTQTKATAN